MNILNSEPQLGSCCVKAGRWLSRHFGWRLFCFLVIYLIITNGVFWLAQLSIHAYRYEVVLEYVWIAPLLFFRNKITTVLFSLLFALVYVVDVTYWIRQFFPMVTLADAGRLLTFLPFAPKIYWVFLAFGVVYLWLSFFLIIRLARLTNIRMVLPYAVLYGLFYLFVFDYRGVNFSDHLKTTGWWGSMYETFQNLKFNRNLSWHDARGPNFQPTELPSVLQQQIDVRRPPNKVLFVLNESWGVYAQGADVDVAIVSPITQLRNVEVIAQGESESGDGTIMGEIREMCRLRATSPNFSLGPFNQFTHCLPRALKRKGYKVESYHGADQGMYDRQNWYPELGFTLHKFYFDLQNKTRCRSFPGACDVNLAQEIARENAQNGDKQFIYWLTLNSHHPYEDEDIRHYAFDCGSPRFINRQEACRNINLQHQFFDDLANQIKTGAFKGTDVIVVGDHNPPLVMDADKDSFKMHKVAFIHFKVND